METSSDVRPAGDFEQSQIQSTQIETLEVLRGIRGLLERIDGRLEDHGRRLIDIEKKTSDEEGKGKEKEIVDQGVEGKEEDKLAQNEKSGEYLDGNMILLSITFSVYGQRLDGFNGLKSSW